jgi:hypothetical protein
MKDTSQVTPSTCPPAEDLSAWHDGEVRNPEIGTHVQACPRCDAVVTFYGRVDAAVRAVMAPPPGLAGRICAACRADTQSTPRVATPWPVTWMRIAAGLAVLAGVTAIALHTWRRDPRSPDAPPESGPSTPLVAVAEPPAHASPAQTPPAPPDPTGASAVQPPGAPIAGSTLALANASGSRPGAAVDGRPAVAIGSVVRHVWVVRDPDACRRALLATLQDDTTTDVLNETVNDDGTVAIDLALPDHRLQTVVDHLATHGAALVSRQFPQPGQAARTHLSGHRVVYQLAMVPPVD